MTTTYGLDGIDFDDEWTNYGANGTPQPSAESFGWLATALRERLGDDKIISLYAIGPSYTTTDFTLFDTAGVLDYAWNPYYPTYDAPTVPGLEDRTRIGAAAIRRSAPRSRYICARPSPRPTRTSTARRAKSRSPPCAHSWRARRSRR